MVKKLTNYSSLVMSQYVFSYIAMRMWNLWQLNRCPVHFMLPNVVHICQMCRPCGGEKTSKLHIKHVCKFLNVPGGLALTFTWAQNYTPAAIKKHEKLH